MQNITIDNKIYKLPTSWDEVNIEQFYKIVDLITKSENIEDITDDVFYSKLYAIFTDKKAFQYRDISYQLSLEFENCLKFISTTEINNEQYTNKLIINNMIIKIKNYDKFTFGEYIDAQNFAKMNDAYGNINLFLTMSEFYLKKNYFKLRFKDKKLDFTNERKEAIISQLPATHAKAITNFFLLGQQQLGRNTASFLNKLALRLAMKSLLQTVGLIIYGLWMRVVKTLLSLVMLLTFRLDKCSRIWHTKLPRII